MSKLVQEELPDEVRKLRLGSAFRGYAKSIKGCITLTSEARVLIVDDHSFNTHISHNTNDECRACIAINPENHQLVVLSIDHVLVSQHCGGMADGAVFDYRKFAFIEFKDEAHGNSVPQIEKTYDKAISQLHEAILLFKNKTADVKIDFINAIDIECHIIVSESFPRVKTTEQQKMISFPLYNYNVPLSFERNVNF